MTEEVSPPIFEKLVGLRLSTIRRAVDMVMLHFGETAPHSKNGGPVGQLALHVQGPWRLNGKGGPIVGSGDLRAYGGPDPAPEHWRYDDGDSVQDKSFDRLFGRGQGRYDWVVSNAGFTVSSISQRSSGDLKIAFVNDASLLVFVDSVSMECWRLLKLGAGGEHWVFPSAEAVVRR